MATAAEDTGKRIYVPASVREFLLRRCPDLPALRVSRRPCTFAFPCLQRQQQSYLLLFPDLRARPGSLCFLRWRVSCSWFFGFSGISLPVSRLISFHYTIDGAAGDNARADRYVSTFSRDTHIRLCHSLIKCEKWSLNDLLLCCWPYSLQFSRF